MHTFASLPIVSPHGHTQAAWFARNEPFPDPAKLFVQPDHYVYRMLYSQGVSMEDLEIGQPEIKNPRKVWHIFASHYYLFRGTPTRIWLDYAFQELFGLEAASLGKNRRPLLRHHRRKTANSRISARALSTSDSISKFLPRPIRLWTRWPITRPFASPAGKHESFQIFALTLWSIRSFPALHNLLPNSASKPAKIRQTWSGYLSALRKARARFRALGCTATDHGHPTAQTANLDPGGGRKVV